MQSQKSEDTIAAPCSKVERPLDAQDVFYPCPWVLAIPVYIIHARTPIGVLNFLLRRRPQAAFQDDSYLTEN